MHFRSQVPQWASLSSAVSHPSTRLILQSSKPAVHVKGAHWRFPHPGGAVAPPPTVPHRPPPRGGGPPAAPPAAAARPRPPAPPPKGLTLSLVQPSGREKTTIMTDRSNTMSRRPPTEVATCTAGDSIQKDRARKPHRGRV